MEFVGEIVRLQIQRSSLKVGPRNLRQYDPAPIQHVPALIVGNGGVLTWDTHTGLVLDVHHRDHPEGKNRDGIHDLSILFTSHYQAMQTRFGPHLRNGIAGESILVQSDRMISLEDVGAGLLIVTANDERVPIHIFQVSEPCVEFTRYSLGRPPDAPGDIVMKEALQFLRGGMRGFYAGYAGDPVTIRLGDRMYLQNSGT